MHADTQKVLEFYRAFKQEEFIYPKDRAPSINERVASVKLDLIAEEFIELVAAVRGSRSAAILAEAYHFSKAPEMDDHVRDVVAAADATADLRYVLAGFDIEAGIPTQEIFDEVHASNMSKLDGRGEPVISDGTDGNPAGKILKGKGFFEPRIAEIIRRVGLDEGAEVIYSKTPQGGD